MGALIISRVVISKPSALHDRERQWATLSRFAARPGEASTLGLVYGRRRQGKTLMLDLLAQAVGGLMFTGLREASPLQLARLAEAYAQVTGGPLPRFDTWRSAIDSLLRLGERRDEPVLVVLDEFPYLVEAEPSLPSIIQLALEPLSAARRGGRTRLILCGSALHVMRGLLAGTAPLRGRAEVEVLVHPFGFRDAAGFWAIDDIDTAFRVHALLGGTPAYRDMAGGPPDGPGDIDKWVARGPLDPDRALFREGAVLLQEEPGLHDIALYQSTLTAIARGATRPGQVAASLGRPATALAHPLAVLEQVGLVVRIEDALRRRRPTLAVAEPVIRLHQLVIAPNEPALVAGRAPEVWARVADTVSSGILGPHWEHLARQWCLDHAAPASIGGVAGRVQPAVVACRKHPGGHEIDIVVTAIQPDEADAVVALGEAKAGTAPLGPAAVERLAHVRDLITVGRHASDPRLLLFARGGFTPQTTALAARRGDVELIDLERLYRGA